MPTRRRALNWDRDKIEALSDVRNRGIEGGKAWWENHTKARYQGIPYAVDVPDEEALEEWPNMRLTREQKALAGAGTLLFWWRARYWTQTVRAVSRPGYVGAAQRAVTSSTMDATTLCQQLRMGGISLAQWQLSMTDMIVYSHSALAMAAGGGAEALTEAQILYAEEMVSFQLDKLNGLAQRIADGAQKIDGGVCRLARMYENSARGTFWGIDNMVAGDYGFTEYRNVLGANEAHCDGGNGCIGVSDMGWQPVGSLTPIGARACMSNCQCSWEYRNALTGEVW